MPTDQILTLLITERDKLNRAIEALQGSAKPKNQLPVIDSPEKKRHVSLAARRKMAAAQKKRWAAAKDGK